MASMNDIASGSQGGVIWAAGGRVALGERESGDRFVVKEEAGDVLIGVVDGLGHGPDAVAAAIEAVTAIEERIGDPLDVILRHCHDRLRGTRGAVVTLVQVDGTRRKLTWAGVGDVDAVLVPGLESGSTTRERIRLAGGIVGHNLPSLLPAAVPVAPGDTVAVATDGVRPTFPSEIVASVSPALLAARILERHLGPADDALVLVARPTGEVA
jgi:negative regulator of sigma-B (phosphoserine phosphatase)